MSEIVKSMPDNETPGRQIEFALARGQLIRSGPARGSILLALVSSAALITLRAVGTLDWGAFLQLGGLGLFGLAMFILGQWVRGRARVLVDDDGVTFRSSQMDFRLAWRHIVSADVRVANRWFSGGHPRHVEVKVSQSPKTNLFQGDIATDRGGISGLFPKTYRFHVQDPDALLQVIESHLSSRTFNS